MKKLLTVMLVLAIALTGVFANGEQEAAVEKSEVQKIIEQAQSMSLDELLEKAYEESNGKTFTAVGNSSRGKTALTNFVKKIQEKHPDYTLGNGWSQPKNNSIFTMLTADAVKEEGTYAMTLIQDGNQIESKMVQTGYLDAYYPKEWIEANGYKAGEYKGYLPLQTLNKVFEFNNVNGKKYDNFWDFVAAGEHGLFMDVDSEVVGKNFLYMLTAPKYAKLVKEAYDALSASEKAYFDKTINAVAKDAAGLGLDENGKYALAWIKLWVESYNAQTDDGPICNILVDKSAAGQFGLIVYSKLRSVTESASVSKNNVTVAAYQDNYKGIGGYGYCHYLFVTDNSPLPWTACAFISYMVTEVGGFEAWGKDIGGYSSNPVLAEKNEAKFNHKIGGMAKDGSVAFATLNDRGYDWWVNEGMLVLEDPEYCAKVSFTVGAWIDMLTKYGK